LIKAFRKHLKAKLSAHIFDEIHQAYLAEINENVILNFNIRNEQIDNDQNEQIEDMHNVAITALDF